MINPKKLFIKNIIMLGFFVIGLVLCIVFNKLDPGHVGGFAGGIAVLVFNLIRCIRLMKNEEYKKQVEIDTKDERTLMLNSKTSEITSFIIVMLCCTGGIISLLLEKLNYLYIFGGIVLVYAVVYCVVKAVLNKKY